MPNVHDVLNLQVLYKHSMCITCIRKIMLFEIKEISTDIKDYFSWRLLLNERVFIKIFSFCSAYVQKIPFGPNDI